MVEDVRAVLASAREIDRKNNRMAKVDDMGDIHIGDKHIHPASGTLAKLLVGGALLATGGGGALLVAKHFMPAAETVIKTITEPGKTTVIERDKTVEVEVILPKN